MKITLLQLAIPVTLLVLASCGASSEVAPADGTGQGVPTSEENFEGQLTLTIGDRTWTSEGGVRESGMTLNKTDLHLQLDAKLAGGPSVAVAISKKDLQPGTFALVSNSVTLDVKPGEKLAWVKVIGEGDLPTFTLRDGSLTFSSLVTTEEGYTNYKVLAAKGSFEGKFTADGGDATASGSFDYRR